MTHRAIVMFSILVLFLMSVGVSAKAGGQAPTSDPAARAVRAFYTYHLAHKKDFNVRNIQLRKRFLSAELYDLLMKQLKKQAAEAKAHPDEAPEYEGDPLTDSQEYPDSFRVGKSEVSGDTAKVSVTLLWSARTSRGKDKRDIVVEVTKVGAGWLIKDIINNEGKRLTDDLKKS